ncbi:hypothetical protein V5R22_31025 [Bacillus thuringiensis]|nr:MULTISPECIES: hypothetical protein [Bacillus cereus group]ETE97308.1 NADH dehydrogenase [Bacillus thuringiensis serovar aizawai str. Hu4-2]MDA2536834.1 hypothetical protein [Bacillus cereus]MEB9462580.1 hypothetical protein [Bacillus cereus]MEC2963189.1 hypothetical protein [Bacillus cereus]
MSNSLKTTEEQEVRELQRVVIKEELVELTGKHFEAALLNNLIFWHGITEKMDQSLLVQISQLEKRGAKQGTINKKKTQIRDGWFFKTADELSAELIGWGSPQKIGRALNELSKNGWIEKGNNPDPKMKWDRTTWLKVNINKIAADLFKIGYALEGYSLVQETEEKPKVFESTSAKIASLRKFHFGICKFHFGSSKFQNGRTIPEGLLQKVTSEKEFEEEEENNTLRVTQSMILNLMNQKIKEREITNQKTIKAIHDVASKCKAIGTTDLIAAENYVIKVAEEKMSKLGQKQKSTKDTGTRIVRSEMIPDWKKESATTAAENHIVEGQTELRKWDDLSPEFKDAILPSIVKAINDGKNDEEIASLFRIVIQDVATLRRNQTAENQKRLDEMLKKYKRD